VATLKEQVEQRLHKMIQRNPTRIDFYNQYMEIIKEYNDGKDKVRLEHVFQELVVLVQKMNAEEQRVAKEGLTEEQSAVFDLLLKPQLSTKDREEVKALAIQLLDKLKDEPLQVSYWSDKNSIAADVRSVINMYLFEQLPEPYSQSDIDEKTITLFNHFKSTYYGGGRSAYA
jgi:type I restriction enzyme R subunit